MNIHTDLCMYTQALHYTPTNLNQMVHAKAFISYKSCSVVSTYKKSKMCFTGLTGLYLFDKLANNQYLLLHLSVKSLKNIAAQCKHIVSAHQYVLYHVFNRKILS